MTKTTIKTTTLEQVKKVLLFPEFLLEEGNVTPNADLVDDLGFDSLDLVEMCITLEEEFKCEEITEAEGEALKSVADVVALMEKKAKK